MTADSLREATIVGEGVEILGCGCRVSGEGRVLGMCDEALGMRATIRGLREVSSKGRELRELIRSYNGHMGRG